MENTIWIILGIVSAFLLVIYFRSRNAVWGGFTIGLIVGLLIALFSGFDWYIVGKSAVSGTVVGFGAEMLVKISDLIKKKQ